MRIAEGGAPTREALRAMQALASEVARLDPALLNAEATPGELAWEWGKGVDALGGTWRHAMWFEGDVLLGWGWAKLPYRLPRAGGGWRESSEAMLVWQVRPERGALLGAVLDWFSGVAGGVARRVIVQSADPSARAVAEGRGYVYDEEDGGEDGDWLQFNARGLDEVATPVLPAGFRFLNADEVSAEAALLAHQAAWENSTFDAVAFARVRGTWPYRGDLHVLVAAPDGTLVASAVMWLDSGSGTAEFEPVGTHAGYRRRRIGTALMLHGMLVAREAGARTALVACRGGRRRPGPRGLYYGVGFERITRDWPMVGGVA